MSAASVPAEPFAWPLRLGSARLFWLALGLTLLLNAGYTALVPVQPTIPLIKSALQSAPFTTVLAVAVVGPIAEEILFRGLLFGALQRRLPTSAVIIVAAFLFACGHLQWTYIPPLFLMGIVAGGLRWKSGSLGPSIFLHCLNNGLSLLFLALAKHSS